MEESACETRAGKPSLCSYLRAEQQAMQLFCKIQTKVKVASLMPAMLETRQATNTKTVNRGYNLHAPSSSAVAIQLISGTQNATARLVLRNRMPQTKSQKRHSSARLRNRMPQQTPCCVTHKLCSCNPGGCAHSREATCQSRAYRPRWGSRRAGQKLRSCPERRPWS
jgi:hypothetical protein